MASTNHTTNYNLSQFEGTDKPAWLSDYNGDMAKIDAGMQANKLSSENALTNSESALLNSQEAQSNSTSALSTANQAKAQSNQNASDILTLKNRVNATLLHQTTATYGDKNINIPLATLSQYDYLLIDFGVTAEKNHFYVYIPNQKIVDTTSNILCDLMINLPYFRITQATDEVNSYGYAGYFAHLIKTQTSLNIQNEHSVQNIVGGSGNNPQTGWTLDTSTTYFGIYRIYGVNMTGGTE